MVRNWLIRNAVLPAGDLMLGHPMMRRLRFLEQAQWWSPERVEAERGRLLREVVATACREVPFYREHFERSGVRPEDIREPADLRRLQVVTKPMLREGYPSRVCRDTGRRTYETSTSGSTGSNFWVREDHDTAGWYRASFMLSLGWAGWKVGEPHLQTGITIRRNLERRIKDALMGCHYFLAYRMEDDYLDRCLEVLDSGGVRHLWGYPSSLFYLAERARKRGFNRKLVSIVTWGDQLFPAYRKSIEASFGAPIHDTYGCGEGIQIAAQCGAGPHYHIHSLDVIVEFLDDHGNPVPRGTPGNIVLTRLHAGPMPFLRYQVGDVGVEGDPVGCSCGRGFATMQSVVGRTADVVTTPSGNRLVVHFFTGVLEHFPEIRTFQIVQSHPDSLLVRIVPETGYSEGSAERIRSALIERGADLDIRIETVDDIPLTPGGKRRFVIRTLS